MPISLDDVKWAYNLVLLRDPENEGVAQKWANIYDNTRDLVDALRSTAESVELRNSSLARAGLDDLSETGILRKLSQQNLNTYNTSSKLQGELLTILRLLHPHRAIGAPKIRIGKDNDGGYVMIDSFSGINAAYSLGINDDVSWDIEIADKGIPVFQYDHTIDKLPVSHDLFYWSKKGIEGTETSNQELDTLGNIVSANGHSNVDNLLLKCDIEGHEWDMMANASPELVGLFAQIVIEIHFTGDWEDSEYIITIKRAVENLTAQHRVVHVHANNCAPYSIAGGIPLPSVIELTLLRNDESDFCEEFDVFPTSLDMPNSPSCADYALGCFRF